MWRSPLKFRTESLVDPARPVCRSDCTASTSASAAAARMSRTAAESGVQELPRRHDRSRCLIRSASPQAGRRPRGRSHASRRRGGSWTLWGGLRRPVAREGGGVPPPLLPFGGGHAQGTRTSSELRGTRSVSRNPNVRLANSARSVRLAYHWMGPARQRVAHVGADACPGATPDRPCRFRSRVRVGLRTRVSQNHAASLNERSSA